MRLLHILRDGENAIALGIISAQIAAGEAVAVVLMNATAVPALDCDIYAITAQAKGEVEPLSHEGLVELMFRAESVVTW